MFCAKCGRNLIKPYEPRPICGNISEPLRSFKKLDVDIAGTTAAEPENDLPMPEKKIVIQRVYRNNPRQKKIIKILCMLMLISIVVVVVFFLRNHSIKTALHEQSAALVVSEDVYDLTGMLEFDETGRMLDLGGTAEVNVGGTAYTVEYVYLSPTADSFEYIDGAKISISGRICRINNDKFMLIEKKTSIEEE